MADERNELRHRRAGACAQVGFVNADGSRERGFAIWKHLPCGGLVRDQRSNELRVPRHQRERVDRAATAREDVDRPGVQCRDHSAQVAFGKSVHQPTPGGLYLIISVVESVQARHSKKEDRRIGRHGELALSLP